MLPIGFNKTLFLFLAGIIILGGFLFWVAPQKVLACFTDDECGAGYYCVSGECKANEIINSTGCFTDDECGAGRHCESGACKADEIISPTSCDTDDECGAGRHCESGACKADEIIDSPDSTDNTDNTNRPIDNTSRSVSRTGSASLPNFLGVRSIGELFLKITNFLIGPNGVVMYFAGLMLIYAGFLFVTAQGSEEKLKTAKKNFVWTVVGIAVILASGAIVNYIMEALGVPGASGSTLLAKIMTTLRIFIQLLFVLVTVYFFWGVAEFVRASGTGGKGVEEGKRHMVWGIIGMAVMLGAWGIAEMIRAYFT